MAGTSFPFFLFPTGAAVAATKGGFRSFFAFWMGGASYIAATPITGSMAAVETGVDTMLAYGVSPKQLNGHYKGPHLKRVIILQGR